MQQQIGMQAWGKGSTGVAKTRWMTSALFVVDGAGFGVWAALLPSLQSRLALSEAQLGIAMFGMVLGAFTAMLFIGRVVGRFGSARLLRWIAPAYGLILCGPVIAPSLGWLTVFALLFGLVKGSFDVSLNVQALAVEHCLKRAVMSGFQAYWSLGGLLSALAIGFALANGFSALAVSVLTGSFLLIAGLLFSRNLEMDTETVGSSSEGGRVFHWAIVPVGLLAFAALFTEGVLMDWSAVYALNVGEAPVWAAPLAYGVFCFAMALGRLVGDFLKMQWGEVNLLRWSGGFALVGLLTQVGIQEWPAIFVGLLLAGFGLANLVPIFMRAAAKAHPGGAARGVAAVSSIGYVGFLAGPPLVGWLAHEIGLPFAFGIVSVLALLISVKGPSLAYGKSRKSRGDKISWREQTEF